MKKLIFIGLAIALIPTQSFAQWGKGNKVTGNGNVITKNFTTSDYSGVVLNGSMDAYLYEGKEGTIEVTAESNVMDVIEVYVKDDKLYLSIKSNTNLNTRKGIKFKVPVESIQYASVSGSGDMTSNMTIKGNYIKMNVSGSGDMNMNIQVDKAVASVTGSGDLKIKGTTKDFEASVTGSGDLSAYELKATNVDGSVTGSGDLNVYCDGGELKNRVTGSGDIRYKGNPKNTNNKVVGSGDITRM